MAGVSKDVQEELLQARSRARTSGRVPYPVRWSHKQLASDNWNQMFLKTLCRNVSMHQFEKPPTNVLDLGCGSGLWVLEGAKVWKTSKFVGFDLLKLQPDLTSLKGPDTENLVDRVKWVHGNFYFDFVRMCSLGLAIPEDEWHEVLHEVCRVLRPGGVLEIIEEDLVFPCGRTPTVVTLLPQIAEAEASQVSIPLSATQSTFSNISPSLHSVPSVNHLPQTSPRSQHHAAPPSVSQNRPPLKNTLSLDSSVNHHNHRNSIRSIQSNDPSIPDYNNLLNPQDHSRLKASWLEMLHHRFLSPKLISVLPFYLSSVDLKDIKTLPTLHIPLPPNSDSGNTSTFPGFDTDSIADTDSGFFVLDFKSQSTRLSSESKKAETASISSRVSRSAYSSAWASMHLARTVHLIEGCKDEIFQEFRKKQSPIMHMQDDMDGTIARAEFEAAWANWMNDMKDRMGLRNKLQHSLSWSISDKVSRPDWRVWRARVGAVETDTTSIVGSPERQDTEVCRSLRGFVAWRS